MLNHHEQFAAALRGETPFLALAPMQDVTDGAFWKLMHRYGGADVYWTEYFRVHATSRLEKWIVQAIENNSTGRPVVAQMIGNDIPSLVRTAKELQQLPVAAVDLNLGCPAPVVYRKCAGGGLLREPQRIDSILGALRDAVSIKFTVKTRVGFESPAEFDSLLPIFAKHPIDLLTVHARTVVQMYRLPVHYDLICRAAETMKCPVMANGHVYSAVQALAVLNQTQARGLMIGRGVIRSPWLFNQIRQRVRGEPVTFPTGREVLDYITALWESQANFDALEKVRVERMKKFMNYLGEGVGTDGQFLHQIRRAETTDNFFRICREFLDHDQPMLLEPSDEAARVAAGAAQDAGTGRRLNRARQAGMLRRVRTKTLLYGLALASAFTLAGCKPAQESSSVSGTIETDEARVASRYGGRVEKTLAQEGDALIGGQVIVELEAAELHAQRDRIAAVLAEAEAGPRKEEIATAKADWEALMAQLDLARTERKRADELFAGKTISETERDRAVTNEQALEKSAAAAKSRYDLLLAGTRPEQIAQTRAQLAELETHLCEMRIAAPTNCVLEVLSVKVGDVLAPNQPVATLLLTNHIWVRVFVPESWLGHIAVGDAVKVRVDAFLGKDFAGVVEQIRRSAEFTPRNVQTVGERVKQVFGVKVRLDNAEGQLRAGMAADVVFPNVVR